MPLRAVLNAFKQRTDFGKANLAEALSAEKKHVSELVEVYQTKIDLLRRALSRADDIAILGDAVAILRSYEQLRDVITAAKKDLSEELMNTAKSEECEFCKMWNSSNPLKLEFDRLRAERDAALALQADEEIAAEERLPFNGLTPAEAERLALLSEELGETVQAIGKVLRHGYENSHPDGGPTNRESLERECGDVRHAILRLCDAGDLREAAINEHADDKAISVQEYLHHAT